MNLIFPLICATMITVLMAVGLRDAPFTLAVGISWLSGLLAYRLIADMTELK